MTTAFQIKTPVFEGPLDVLLDLIEKRKLLINDISLAQVADEYIAYVKNFTELPVEHAADFVFIASTLVLIKSKSLLPTLDLTAEEEGSIADLERRLAEYKRIKELSIHVRELFGKHVIFERTPTRSLHPVFSPTEEITVPGIVAAMEQIINTLPKKQLVPQAIVAKVISLEEMMDRLTERIQTTIKMSFKDFVGETKERVNVIVGFLALLELVKQGVVAVAQQGNFDEIHIDKHSESDEPIESVQVS